MTVSSKDSRRLNPKFALSQQSKYAELSNSFTGIRLYTDLSYRTS